MEKSICISAGAPVIQNIYSFRSNRSFSHRKGLTYFNKKMLNHSLHMFMTSHLHSERAQVLNWSAWDPDLLLTENIWIMKWKICQKKGPQLLSNLNPTSSKHGKISSFQNHNSWPQFTTECCFKEEPMQDGGKWATVPTFLRHPFKNGCMPYVTPTFLLNMLLKIFYCGHIFMCKQTSPKFIFLLNATFSCPGSGSSAYSVLNESK